MHQLGGLKRVEDAKTGALTLALGDRAKLKATVEEARATLTPAMLDVLIAQCVGVDGDHGAALIALLRIVGEGADNKRAGAFVAWFEALRSRDTDQVIALFEDAARRFLECNEQAWQVACYNEIGNVLRG